MKIVRFIPLCIAAFSLSATAQSLEFQGFKLGATLEAVKARYDGAQCLKLELDDGDMACMLNRLDYAVPLTDVMFTFSGDRLVMVTARFESTAYADLRKAALERFGKPTTAAPIRLQNGFGATRTGGSLLWERGDTTFVIGEYSESLAHGRLFFRSSKPKPDNTATNARKM